MRLVLCLFVAAPAWARGQDAGPALKLPAEVSVRPGALGELRAETAGTYVRWLFVTPGLDARVLDNGKALLFTGPEGVYVVFAYTAAGDVPGEAVKCVITIGPPGPAPPPTPVDPLRAKLRSAFGRAAGTPAEKREWAKDLAALYRAAAKLVPDPGLVTAGQLKLKLKDASATLIGPDALKEVRQAVAVELAAVLPTTDADLTDAHRATAAALFTRLATVLDGLAAE